MERPHINLHESSVDPSSGLTPSPKGNSISENLSSALNSTADRDAEHSNSSELVAAKSTTENDETDQTQNDSKPEKGKSIPEPAGSETTGRLGSLNWLWAKRDRLKRDPSMDKLDEEADPAGARDVEDQAKVCPDYFGVKSYLHHFYEWQSSYKDPEVYEDEWGDSRRLLHPGGGGRCSGYGCSGLCWKLFVFIGAGLLVAGTVAVLTGYLLPQKPTRIATLDDDKEVIDRDVIKYDQQLGLCKLIGLILFSTGGLTLAVSLMVPSFLYRYCDDEKREAPFSVQSGDVAPACPAKDTSRTVVPAATRLAEIQPARKTYEGIVVHDTAAEQKVSLSATKLQN